MIRHGHRSPLSLCLQAVVTFRGGNNTVARARYATSAGAGAAGALRRQKDSAGFPGSAVLMVRELAEGDGASMEAGAGGGED
jgi:hypothetical protein